MRKEFPNATYKPNDSDVNPEIFVACRLLRHDVRIGALDYFSACISEMDVMYTHVHAWRRRSRGIHYTFNGNILTYRGNTGINGVIRILTVNPGALGKYHNFVKFNKNCEMHVKTGDANFDNLFAIYVSDSCVKKYVLDMLSKEEILDIRYHYSEFAILVDNYHVYIAIPGQEPLLNNLLLTKDAEPEEWLREFRNQVYAIVDTIRDIKDIFIK